MIDAGLRLAAKKESEMQNIFWEIEGVKGESTSAQGKDMIELLAFNHGVSMPLTAGPSNTSRASYSARRASRTAWPTTS